MDVCMDKSFEYKIVSNIGYVDNFHGKFLSVMDFALIFPQLPILTTSDPKLK